METEPGPSYRIAPFLILKSRASLFRNLVNRRLDAVHECHVLRLENHLRRICLAAPGNHKPINRHARRRVEQFQVHLGRSIRTMPISLHGSANSERRFTVHNSGSFFAFRFQCRGASLVRGQCGGFREFGSPSLRHALQSGIGQSQKHAWIGWVQRDGDLIRFP